MSRCDMLPFWTDAYLGDTSHLSTEEHGAYLLLLVHAWRSKNCSIPNDDKKLARIVRLSPLKWKKIKCDVLSFWKFDEVTGGWTQKRLLKEHDKQKKFSKAQSERAKKRWSNEEDNSHQENAKSLKSFVTRQATASTEIIPAEAEFYYTVPKGRKLTQEQARRLIYEGGRAIDRYHPSIQDMTIPSQWIEKSGATDFDLDVLPTIIRLSKKPRAARSIKSWEYFTSAIMETRDRRELNNKNMTGVHNEHSKVKRRTKQASVEERRRRAAFKVVSQYTAD